MDSFDSKFVIRLCQDRKALTEDGVLPLSQIMEQAPLRLRRRVKLSKRQDGKRGPGTKKKHPSREERNANLEIRSQSVTILRPKGSKAKMESITVSVERNPFGVAVVPR
jgi:hypothetical protein